MNPFQVGDIVVVKPEYSRKLMETYSYGYSTEKCKFGMAVARGTPAKVAATSAGSIELTDLEETLRYDNFLRLASIYFDANIVMIPDDLL